MKTHPCGPAAGTLLWCNALVLGALAALLMSARSLEGMKSSSSLSLLLVFENTPVPWEVVGALGAEAD